MADKIAKSIKDLEKKNNDVLVFCKHTGDVFQTQLKEDKGTLYMSIENNNGKKDWVEYDANNFSKVDLFENYKNLSLYEYLEFGKGSEFVEGLVKQIYGVELKEVYNYSKYNDETYKVRANWENFAKEINDISTKIAKEFDPDSKKSKAEYVQLYAAEIYDKLSSTEFFDVAQDIYVYKEVSEKGKSVEEAIKDFGVIKEGKESDEILANYAAESAAAKSKLNTLSIMIHNPEHFARPSGKDKDKRDGWFSFIYPLAIRILAVGPAAVGLCSYKDIKERYPIGKTTAEYAVIKAKFEEYKFMQNEVDKKDMTYEDAKMRNEEIKKEYAGIFAGLNKELDSLNKETDKAEKEKTNLTSEKEKLEEKLANEKEPKAIEKLNEQIKDKDEKIKNVDAKLENLKDKKQDLADKTKDTVEKYKLDSRNAIERNHKAKNEARVEYVKSKNEFEKVKKEFDKMESDKKKLDPNSKEFKELEVKLEAKGKELDVADKKLINAEINLKDVKAAKPSEYEINKIEKELNLDKPETNIENKVEETTKHETSDMSKDSSSEKTQDVSGKQDKYIINKYENIYNFKSADKLGDIYTEKSFEFTMTNNEGKTEVITEKNLKTFDSEIIKDLAKYLNENKYAIHPKIEQTFNEAYKESCSRENIEYNPKERLFDDFYVFKIEEVLVETTDENNKDRIGKPTIYTARECYSRNFILEKTYDGKTETFTPKDINKMSSHDINLLMTEVKNRDWKFSKKIEKRLENTLQQKREIENNTEKETEKIVDNEKTTDSVAENSIDKNTEIKETTETKEKVEEKTIDKTEVSENSNEKPSEVTEKSKQDLTRGIESISKEKDEIKKNIDKLENKIDAKYSKIEKTKADLEKTPDPQQKHFLEKKIDNMRNDISNWKNEVATEKERLNKLENNLKTEMDNFEKGNDKIEQSVEKRTENKSDIGSYIDKFLDKFGAVLGNDIKDSLIDLKNGFEELENKIDEIEQKEEVKTEITFEKDSEKTSNNEKDNPEKKSDEEKEIQTEKKVNFLAVVKENFETFKSMPIEKQKEIVEIKKEMHSIRNDRISASYADLVSTQNAEKAWCDKREAELNIKIEDKGLLSFNFELCPVNAEELVSLAIAEYCINNDKNISLNDEDYADKIRDVKYDKNLINKVVEIANDKNDTKFIELYNKASEKGVFWDYYGKQVISNSENTLYFFEKTYNELENIPTKDVEVDEIKEMLDYYDKINDEKVENNIETSNEKELSKDELKAEIADTKEKIDEVEHHIENKQATPEQIAEVEAQEQAARERAENQISEEDLAAYEAQEKARLEAEQQENENSVDPSSDVVTDTAETIADESSQDNVVGQEELIQEENPNKETENQNVEVEQDSQDKVEDNSRKDTTDKTIEKYDNSFKKTIESMQVVYKDIAVNFDKINTRKDLYDVGKVVDFALKVEDHNKDVQILEVAPDTLKLGENKENENHDINITRGDEGKFNTVGLEGSGYMFEVDKNIVDGRVKNFEGNLSEFIGNRIENAKITNVLEFNPDTEKFEKIDLDNLTDKDKEDIASALESLIEDKDKVSNILEHSDIFDKDEDKNKDKYEFDEEAETFDEDELLTDDMEIPNVLDNLDVDDMNLVDNEPFNVDIPDDNQLENNLDDYNNDYDYDYDDSEN